MGVYSGYTDSVMVGGLSTGELFYDYADYWHDHALGISLAGCDLNSIYDMYEAGVVDWSFARTGILNSRSWTQSISYILFAVSALLVVITLITLIAYCFDIFVKGRREMGVLRSLGVKPIKIICVYLPQLAVIACVVLAVSALTQIAVIALWNVMLGVVADGMPVFYYGIQGVGVSLALLAIVVAAGSGILLAMIKRKTAAELVYER